MSDIPERIWLQMDEDREDYDNDLLDETTWCRDRINSDDVEYVLVDLHRELQQRLAVAEADVARLTTTLTQMYAAFHRQTAECTTIYESVPWLAEPSGNPGELETLPVRFQEPTPMKPRKLED